METVKAKPLIHLIEGDEGRFNLTQRMLDGFGFDGDERDINDAYGDLVREAERRGLNLTIRDHFGTDHWHVRWWR